MMALDYVNAAGTGYGHQVSKTKKRNFPREEVKSLQSKRRVEGLRAESIVRKNYFQATASYANMNLLRPNTKKKSF